MKSSGFGMPTATSGEGAAILRVVAFGLARTAACGAVMERLAEHVTTKRLPVIAGVGEVQVPGLVDVLAGGHRLPGGHGEEHEPPVLVDDADGAADRPAVFAGESRCEREPRRRLVEAMPDDAGPELSMPRVDGHVTAPR